MLQIILRAWVLLVAVAGLAHAGVAWQDEWERVLQAAKTSPASGIFNRAPHPNAAKVYINWLLSKEGQTINARATGYISNRLDVPTDHAAPWRVPQPGSIKTYTQEAIDKKHELSPILIEVFGR
jgi:hypothetical protein